MLSFEIMVILDWTSPLINAFEVPFFQGVIFYTLPKTLIACRAMQLRFVKSENVVEHCL